MVDSGSDVWSQPACTVLKITTSKKLSLMMRASLESAIKEIEDYTPLRNESTPVEENTGDPEATQPTLADGFTEQPNLATEDSAVEPSTTESQSAEIEPNVEEVAPIPTNGHTQTPPSINQDQLIQSIFDMLYLKQALLTPSHKSSEPLGMEAVLQELRKALTEDIDDNLYERLMKSATDYWKRTYALFGLLV
jgi:hypothetical protein